jgi:glycosyltransferase involved in cell wall biosynthesis
MRHLICLPTYNECENIGFMIDELNKYSYSDFIVSDAFSTDGTADIAKNKGAIVLKRSGHGKGYAVKDALEYATHKNFETLVLLDCDRTYPVEQIKNLLNHIETSDMVVGCRNFKDISFLRRLANYVMTGFTNLVFFSNVSDMATGMRIVKVNKFIGKIDAKYFDVEPQMHCIALREKMKITEVSIDYRKRMGDSKIGIKDLFIILIRVLVERFK